VVAGLEPSAGPLLGGARVTVFGAEFSDGPHLSCAFGARVVPARFLSVSRLTCRAPSGAAGVALVSVSTNGVEFTEAGPIFQWVDRPTVDALVPSSGPPGRAMAVTVFGSGFAGAAITCHFGPSPAHTSPAELRGPHTLVCVAPASQPGTVPFSLSYGGAAARRSQEAASFLVTQAPRLTAAAPSVPPARTASLLTLTGAGFASSTALRCEVGGEVRVPARRVSASEVVCALSPEASAERATHVRLVDHQQASNAVAVTFAPAPLVARASPLRGPTEGGTRVEVVGSGFESGDAFRCFFGDAGVVATPMSSTLLACRSPTRAAGRVSLSVGTRRAGEWGAMAVLPSALEFEYAAPPRAAALVPSQGPRGMPSTIRVFGENFAGDVTVTVDGRAVPSRRLSSSVLECVVPPSATAATAAVRVSLNAVDFSDAIALEYRYESVRGPLAVVPSEAPASGQWTVTIRGAGFEDKSSLACRFGSRSEQRVPGTFVTASEVRCSNTGQAFAVGNVTLALTMNGRDFHDVSGTFALVSTSPSDVPTVAPAADAPAVSQVVPSFGPTIGGTRVMIGGSEFRTGTACRFGESGAPVLGEYVTNTMVACRAPAGLAGDVMVQVSTDGETFSSGRHVFAYVENGRVTQVTPSAVPLSGRTQVTVVGEHFTASERGACKFGSEVVTGTAVSSSMMLCVSPEQRAGDVTVEVSSNGVDFSTDGATLQYTQTAVVYTVQPSAGLEEGGNTVTVTGANIGSWGFSGKRFGCKFGSKEVDAQIASSSSIVCTSPAHAQGRVQIAVSTDGAYAHGDGATYEYVHRARVTRVWPSVGQTEGGTAVRVVGTGFGVGRWSCRFGTAGVSEARQVSVSELACVSPRHEQGGEVAVGVALEGGEYSEDEAVFRYASRPVVESVTPSYGSSAGGYEVTIRGSNLGEAGSDVWVRFGAGEPMQGWFVENGTAVACSVPSAYQPGNATVEIASNGVDFSASYVVFSYVTVGCFYLAPSMGGTAGGTTVRFSLSAVTAANVVECVFGAVHPIPAGWADASTLSCVAPPRNAGDVHVTLLVDGRPWPSTAIFRYLTPVVVSRIEPSSGPLRGGTALRVLGAGFAPGTSTVVSFGAVTALRGVAVSASEVICTSPPRDPGDSDVITVEVSSDGRAFSSSRTAFEYYVEPAVLELRPSTVAAGAPARVTLVGEGFRTGDAIAVRMKGAAAGAAVALSETTAVLAAPALLAPGVHAVELSRNGVDFVPASVHLEVVTSAAPDADGDRRRAELSLAHVALADVLPSFGPEVGSTRVSLIGEGFAPGLSCVFTGPTHAPRCGDSRARAVSSSLVLCTTPRCPVGPSSVGLALASGGDADAGALRFDFVPAWSVAGVQPAVRFEGLAGQVTVAGAGFVSSPALACHFGAHAVSAALLSSSLVACGTAALPAANYTVEVTCNGVDLSLDFTPFRVVSVPTVTALTPSSGASPFGAFVTVAGSNFPDAPPPHCTFGRDAAAGTLLSSSAVRCASPPARPGVGGAIDLGLSFGGVPAGGTLRFSLLDPYEAVIVLTHWPTVGPAHGGTPVHLALADGSAPLAAATALRCLWEGEGGAAPLATPAARDGGGAALCPSPAVPSPRTLRLTLEVGDANPPPPPPSRTKWTRLVPLPVLSGHVSSLAPY
jgi:hypothetical protein